MLFPRRGEEDRALPLRMRREECSRRRQNRSGPWRPAAARHDSLLNSLRLPPITSPHRDLGEQACSTDIGAIQFSFHLRDSDHRNCLAIRANLEFSATSNCCGRFRSNRFPGVISTCRRVIKLPKRTAGCPNLAWELSWARREQVSAQKLLTRNVSERVVDKDNHNHLRDCLKYLALSLPAPAQTQLEVRLAAMAKWHPNH